jgi:hypothetical protein
MGGVFCLVGQEKFLEGKKSGDYPPGERVSPPPVCSQLKAHPFCRQPRDRFGSHLASLNVYCKMCLPISSLPHTTPTRLRLLPVHKFGTSLQQLPHRHPVPRSLIGCGPTATVSKTPLPVALTDVDSVVLLQPD